ncbi:hypothetical protein [Streptomyces sp. NPDC058280]|uniref:hypothetical protein n=1 Tax=Streptomyces sp. NPDC058280 TaxID=3346419 RepID=UPI0036E42AB3
MNPEETGEAVQFAISGPETNANVEVEQGTHGGVRLSMNTQNVGNWVVVSGEFSPERARAVAAAILRAADEAEGAKPGTAERNLLDFIGRAGWDGTAMVSAVVAETRDKVATELETLPTYNDIADWCAHIGRRQAIDTARNGLRQREGE